MLNHDFREFIESSNVRDVRYLIIGGYALVLHGFPRYTKDIDVWIERTADNATRLIGALVDFGFGQLDLPVNVIGVEGLKKNKASTGRKQDLADLEVLEDADGASDLVQ